MTRKELERLVQEMADGSLSQDGFQRLQEELRQKPEARAFFRESMEMELLLAETVGTRISPAGVSGRRMEGLLREQQRRSLKWALAAAAAVVLVSAAVFHHVFVRKPDTGVRIAFTSGTSWQGEVKGGMIEPGSLVNVEFGLAEVVLPHGVRGVIEGPARFRVGKKNGMDLLEGRAWFRVSGEARGFLLSTPQVEVTDLGTEFGVVSRQESLDEVHVFEGRVAVAARFGLKERRELVAGQAVEVSPVGRWIEREPDADQFFKKLPPSLPGIRFSFDGANPLRPDGVHPAVDGMKVARLGGGTPELIEGIHGKALSIHGMDDVVTTDWPGIGGAEPRTIACWIRSDGGGSAYSGIVSWGDANGYQPGRCKLLVARSPRHKWAVLRLSLGEQINFSGSTPLETGRWHHVAAVFRGMHSDSGDMVELYVDGRREKVDPEFSQPPKRDQRIGTVIDSERSLPLRIGTGPYPDASESFHGAIDDVYILPRALSEGEVRALMGE